GQAATDDLVVVDKEHFRCHFCSQGNGGRGLLVTLSGTMSTGIPVERFKALTEAAATVVGTAQLEALLGRLVETAKETTGAKYAALGVIGDHKQLIEFVYRGVDEETARKIGHPPEGRGVLGTLIRERVTVRLDRISDHPDSVGFPPHH